MSNYFRANMDVMSAVQRYARLTGEFLDPAAEYEDFDKNKRPGEGYKAYVDRKYDLTGKEQAKAAEAQKAREDALRAEGRKAAQEEFAKAHGANPETRNPRASRFDVIRSDEGRTASWNRARSSAVATDAVDRSRVTKYLERVN